MLDRPIPSHASRQRRYRARQKNGQVAVTVTLSQDETNKLNRLRCLDLDKLEDRGAQAFDLPALRPSPSIQNDSGLPQGPVGASGAT